MKALRALAAPLAALFALGACASDRTVFPGEEVPAPAGSRGGGSSGGSVANPNGRPADAAGQFTDARVGAGGGAASDDSLLYGPLDGVAVAAGALDGGASDAAAVDGGAGFSAGGGGALPGAPCAVLAGYGAVCGGGTICPEALYRQCRRAEAQGRVDRGWATAVVGCARAVCGDFRACVTTALASTPRTGAYTDFVGGFCNRCFDGVAGCVTDADGTFDPLKAYTDAALRPAVSCIDRCADRTSFGACLVTALSPRVPPLGVCDGRP